MIIVMIMMIMIVLVFVVFVFERKVWFFMEDVKVSVFNALHGSRLSSLTDQLPGEFDYFYIGLYGSQNYNLDNKNSDVDAKAIVVPSFDELIRFKGESKSFSFGDGILDVKDVRLMFE